MAQSLDYKKMNKLFFILKNQKRAEKKAGFRKINSCYYKTEPESGFTLLELLVAMLMVTMVTTIIAVALKLSINSWERAKSQGDAFQTKAVIPFLIKKQLNAVVKEKAFAKGKAPIKLKFNGRENGVSFFTSYTPMAGSMTGLLRVSYVYDRKEKKLFLYQQLILTQQDLKDIHNPLSEKWDDQLEPSGKISDISKFNIRYSSQKSYAQQDLDIVSKVWESKKNKYPESIFLEFGSVQGRKKNSESYVWHFII